MQTHDSMELPPRLGAQLARALRGEVRFDAKHRALYATDSSNYRQPPLGVILPRDADDLIQAVALCREHGLPLVNRGGGTSLTGSATNRAVVLDTSKYMHHILEVNPRERWARVEPGVILDSLRDAADPHGLTFGPDPSTHDHCTLGGMIGNNSCGMHAQMAGRVADNVIELDVLTYDGLRMTVGRTSEEELSRIIAEGGRKGEIYAALRALRDRYAPLIRERFAKIPRRVSGYNLDELLPENGFDVARALTGTESTCVTILQAKLRLVHSAAKRTVVVIGYEDIATAADHVPDLLPLGPIGFEGMDAKLLTYIREQGGEREEMLKLLPAGRAYSLVEFGGETQREADAKADRLIRAVERGGIDASRLRRLSDPKLQEQIWVVREAGLGVTAFRKGSPDTHEGWEDAGVPPERLGAYLRAFRMLLDQYDYDTSLYGHFGQGCVHCRINFDLESPAGIAKYRSFVDAAADLVVAHGGSLSGEHGDGQSRGELLVKMFGEELIGAMREFKRIWDPTGAMNPGKKIDAAPVTAHLRHDPPPAPATPKMHFHYPDDASFAHATKRCVGVGTCRRLDGGTMCPSFMATRDEEHTTRGRAHMLFEMLQGDVVKGGWRDPKVKESLDLCLSCKGCKGDCPVHVDIATLKAEFLSHYYKGRLRPRTAYAMGLIHHWAGLASLAPRLANAFSQTPGLRSLLKAAGGIAQERPLPAFAPETFRAWWQRRPEVNAGRAAVVLWVDTFANHFHPDIAKAAVEVLEDCGFQVKVPRQRLCCGRPLYDYGFLDAAKRLLLRDLAALRSELEDGLPVIGLEPSCMAVFRDELPNLLPKDPLAQRLKKQSFLLGEFLAQRAPTYKFPQLAREALVQAHCHDKAIFGGKADRLVLQKMGVKAEAVKGGCCGMAGSFGFEADKFKISRQIMGHALLPAVQRAPKTTLLVADGFSCRTQIEHATGRKALHLAEVLRLGLAADGRLAAAQRRSGLPASAAKLKSKPILSLGAAVAASIGIGVTAYTAWSLLTKESK